MQPPVVETLAEIEARVRQENPYPQYYNVGGVSVQMTETEYEQWIDDQVIGLHEMQLRAYAEWQRAELRRLLKDSVEALSADIALIESGSNLNLRQVADMLGRTTHATNNLIQVLVDKGIIEETAV